jgi:hypothetical protein
MGIMRLTTPSLTIAYAGIYEFVFKDLQLKLPFSPLAVEIFSLFKLAPSQIHPNLMAFVIAFERLCEYKSVEPTRLSSSAYLNHSVRRTSLGSTVGYY